jgi:hypothetical protein
VTLNLGFGYTGRSGTPLNVLGSHPIYGGAEVFITPRGSGGRTPWLHSIDTNLTVGMQFSKDSALTVGLDVFNLFNFQQVTAYDQNFTNADVLPIPNGDVNKDLPKPGDAPGLPNNKLLRSDGSPFDPADINPNYSNPSAYQQPRQIRINARVTF